MFKSFAARTASGTVREGPVGIHLSPVEVVLEVWGGHEILVLRPGDSRECINLDLESLERILKALRGDVARAVSPYRAAQRAVEQSLVPGQRLTLRDGATATFVGLRRSRDPAGARVVYTVDGEVTAGGRPRRLSFPPRDFTRQIGEVHPPSADPTPGGVTP